MKIHIRMKPDDTVEDLVKALKRTDQDLIIKHITVKETDKQLESGWKLESYLILDVEEAKNAKKCK